MHVRETSKVKTTSNLEGFAEDLLVGDVSQWENGELARLNASKVRQLLSRDL